jgi:hypothetical protein
MDQDYATYFRQRMNRLPEDQPPELVFHMDETCWRLYDAPGRVLEEKGKQTVKLCSHQSEKTSFTAFGGITCSGDKLPLWVIAKGKTERSEAKFGSHPGIIIKHAESGGATENRIVEDLHCLHAEMAAGLPYALILDVYPTPRTDAVMAVAAQCDIELLFVPAGGTSEYHPLNYHIFGELKSRARAEITRLMGIGGGANIDYDQNVRILVNCWTAISGENIRKAWGLPSLEREVIGEEKANQQ